MVKTTDSKAWRSLQQLSSQIRTKHLRIESLFATDENRFAKFSLSHNEILLDYSKQLLTDEILNALFGLAEQSMLEQAIDAMFKGENINNTENRAAAHTSLRLPEQKNQPREVTAALEQMERFVSSIHNRQWLGANNRPISTVVNIGIGGSDLGPAMVVDALDEYSRDDISMHFVSNVDPSHIQSVLKLCDPSETLFIVASKSFSTLETHLNASAARQWFLDNGFSQQDIAKHFVATTSNLSAAKAFGIQETNIFPMWDWVGGRYSLWSTIGLPIALALGMDNFRQLLAGAHDMDEHFRQTPLKENLPVTLGLLAVWNTNFLNTQSTAVIPYSQRLSQLPAYLQQLSMESLGKSVTKNGQAIDHRTGEVIWGTSGTNGQHSYFQLLHQGTEYTAVEFIGFCAPHDPKTNEQHQHLLANFLSQSKALMEGDTHKKDPHKAVAGNKPSTTLLIDKLSPFTLGSLLALYEHKVYVQSIIWGINAFDQWGVQLGKLLSQSMVDAINKTGLDSELDGSTKGLIQRIRQASKT